MNLERKLIKTVKQIYTKQIPTFYKKNRLNLALNLSNINVHLNTWNYCCIKLIYPLETKMINYFVLPVRTYHVYIFFYILLENKNFLIFQTTLLSVSQEKNTNHKKKRTKRNKIHLTKRID